ncbi:hypothetical protein BH10PLA1_BH10PLA1_12800 [soil metagenome]
MNRALSVVVIGMMLAGCATKPSAATLSPAAPAKADYFEVNKGGKTYVFSDIKTMQAFAQTGNAGPTVSDFFGSSTVTFQATGDQSRLMTEYEKQHSVRRW